MGSEHLSDVINFDNEWREKKRQDVEKENTRALI